MLIRGGVETRRMCLKDVEGTGEATVNASVGEMSDWRSQENDVWNREIRGICGYFLWEDPAPVSDTEYASMRCTQELGVQSLAVTIILRIQQGIIDTTGRHKMRGGDIVQWWHSRH